jgi:hypothetical protein
MQQKSKESVMAPSNLIWFELICEELPVIMKFFSEYYDTVKHEHGVALWKTRENNHTFLLCIPNILEKNALAAFKKYIARRLKEWEYPDLMFGKAWLAGDKTALAE